MLLTLALTALVTFASNGEPPLRFGADAQGGAPYIFQDPKNPNRVTGFEKEIADELARRLGRSAESVQAPWDKLLELVGRGDFDIALNGLELADEKKRVARLSRPYLAVAERLTVRKADARAPRTLGSLRGRKVGTLPGSVAERLLTEAGADVRTYDGGQDDVYRDLILGRTDAVLLDAPIATYYALDASLETLEESFGTVTYVAAVGPDNEALLTQVDAALKAMADDGYLRALYERWGLWTPEAAHALGAEFSKATSAPTELERWLESSGALVSWQERVLHRYPSYLPLLARGAAVTLAVSFCAMCLAVLLGLLRAVARSEGPTALRWAATAYVEFFRGTPLLIQLTMVYFGLPQWGVRLDPFTAGVVALGLNYAAAEAENYRAGLSSVPRGQVEAAQVLGLSRAAILRHITAPQAVRIALPPMTNDFIALLKDSSLVSLVTLTELSKSYSSLANATRDHLGLGAMAAFIYLGLGLPFAVLARKAEAHFGRHLRRG